MTESSSSAEVETRTVRPRWTWIALIVLVIGVAVIGWAVVVGSWTWTLGGLVVLAVGGLLALYGGFFYDVQGGGSMRAQMDDVVHGAEHEFPVAGTIRSEAEVKRDVRRRWLGRRD